MTRRFEDASLQTLMDAAAKVMEAAFEDETGANRAIAQMRAVANNLEYRSQEIAKQLSSSIEDVAERTASMTAEKLAEKFRQADGEAAKAAGRYKAAAHLLSWKIAAGAATVQIAMVVAVYGIIVWRLPSIEDAREAQQKMQLAQDTVNRLNAKGGRALLNNCNDNGRNRLCVRTDERIKEDPWRDTKSGASYRIVYGY